ncbi:MAG: HU family DNA-binding protein [Bacteroidales bacterium]|nr:hypothetical protein [Bacteroidales bacterium]
MSIEYKKVKRMITVGPNPGMKYLAEIVRGQTVELDEIYKDMTDLTSLSRGDIMSSIDTLTQLFMKYFKSGRNVNLGEFGRFRMYLDATAVETLEEVTADTIKKPNVRFTMGNELKKEVYDTPKVLSKKVSNIYKPDEGEI